AQRESELVLAEKELTRSQQLAFKGAGSQQQLDTDFLPETLAGRVAIGTETRVVLDAAPQYVFPAKISFVASVAQFTPKTVETTAERQKLVFRVKAQGDPEVLKRYGARVKTGLPGVATVRLHPT